ncbi:hypothetical protein [Chryseobacterium luteum]|uniref:Uncharacterized protein n=1 Tax=Chryseobacterium luteum TaxID=421531 RepID=A0A085ZX75_9FLAO|nr:hypothetical protein [Chryseobacterium luteum]KFF09039.1 hypothetical protein IX38_00540 [Chryseobacterium luteum]
MKYIIFSLIFLVNFFRAQEFPTKFEENGKFGLKDQNNILLPAIYNRISTHILIITHKSDETNIYDQNLSILYKDQEILNYHYSENPDILQIILKNGALLTYTQNGLLNDHSQLILQKESDKSYKESGNSGSQTYTIEKNKIQEKSHHIFVEPEDELLNIKYPIYGQNPKFLNNKKSLEIEYALKRKNKSNEKIIEYGYSEETLFIPLKISYIISKLKSKYGVWDFKEQKIIIPFEYQKIVSHQNYFYLEKNGLSTFYPNIGTEPKYKKLEPYICAFARFETPDGKKGWVDRKGIEYFDQ